MVERYDVVVVGAGPAGSAAAYYLAKRGYNVIVLEKAHVPGQRNVSGGVLYTSYIEGYGLRDLVPELYEEAPLERRITRYRLWMLSRPEKTDGGYRYRFLDLSETFLDRFVHGEAAGSEGYSVLRARFDKWFAYKVVEAGGVVVTDTTVEGLLWEGGRVVGVRTSREEVYGDLVIDASGVTSTLVVEAGLRDHARPTEVYHGVKHVYELGEGEIERRFGVKKGEGVAIALVGDFMYGAKGGGFIYTNRDTVSVGIVLEMSSMLRALRENMDRIGKPLDILEEMESHPVVSRLIEGGRLVEYSAHNVPRGSRLYLKRPYRAGFLVVGDAMGAFIKIRAMIDGMRRAVATGIMAAKTYEYARSRGKFDESTLSIYTQLLEPVTRDVARYRREGLVAENSLVYSIGYKTVLRLLGREEVSETGAREDVYVDAVQRIQARTGLLRYRENREYIHIQVDYEKANRDAYKAWVSACPVNCYTLVVERKGVFASYRDLYRYNKEMLERAGRRADKREVLRITLEDIRRGSLRFDHVACIECGTCWFIGPPDVIRFRHQRDGRGVRFSYG